MKRCSAWIAFVVLVAACGGDEGPKDDPAFARLAEWMTGSFSSAQQAAADPEFFDIRLEMARIWPERTDGYWLYVEQAMAQARAKPYRQRVYRVEAVGDGTYASHVYELPDPEAAVGAWKAVKPLADLGPELLAPREGCTVYLRSIDDETFRGSTRDDACRSTLRGAAYATSEVKISQDRLVSWDRGFDEDGQQVWGATKGGYVFVREP